MTLHEIVAAARQRLTAAGIPHDEATLDARLLAQHLLGWDTVRFHTDAAALPPPSFKPRFESAVSRRLAREPLAYIVGHREFWNLDFEVSPAVLIPRPETELIVESALEFLPEGASFEMCDVGTGSGCLAVAIAVERTGARAIATDTSAAALEIAARNARRHGVSTRVLLVRTDLFDESGPFDLIVSNPPYVPDAAGPALQPEVRDHEPAIALFGGPDGLTVIRRLLAEASARLKPTGLLIFEIGVGQADAVGALISSARGLTMTELRRDLQGIPRTVVVRRS